MNCLIHDGEPRSLPPVFKGVPAHLVNQGCGTMSTGNLGFSVKPVLEY